MADALRSVTPPAPSRKLGDIVVAGTQEKVKWPWGLMTVLSLAVGGYALFLTITGFAFVPASVKANAFPSPLGVYVHIAASGFALLTGPWQFRRSLRTRLPHLHRWIGRTYVAACVIGGSAGTAIAMFSHAGHIAGWGFLLLGIAWLLTTLLGWRAALQRRFADHERWMIRSFALTLAAVTLRIYLPIGITFAHGDLNTPYRAIAWLCWVPNILIAELYLRSRRSPQSTWVLSMLSRSAKGLPHRSGYGCEEDSRTAFSLHRTRTVSGCARASSEPIWSVTCSNSGRVSRPHAFERVSQCARGSRAEEDVRRLFRNRALPACSRRGGHRPRRDGAGADAIASTSAFRCTKSCRSPLPPSAHTFPL